MVTTPWKGCPSISSKFIALKLLQCYVIKQGSLCFFNQLETSPKFQPPLSGHSACQNDDANPTCQSLLIENTLNITQNPTILDPFKKRKQTTL